MALGLIPTTTTTKSLCRVRLHINQQFHRLFEKRIQKAFWKASESVEAFLVSFQEQDVLLGRSPDEDIDKTVFTPFFLCHFYLVQFYCMHYLKVRNFQRQPNL
jgi:hypothetical protein